MSEDEPILDSSRPTPNVWGKDGEIIPQGSRMIEKESYERIIEGTKMAADAASRLARMEAEHIEYWHGWVRRMDAVRKIAIGLAGLGLAIQFQATRPSWGGEAGDWTSARAMFRDGLKQAAGGCRQMATCHRSDFTWSRMAYDLEDVVAKLNQMTMRTVREARRTQRLWMPDSMW
jgi:hypothetical protein